MMLTTSAELHVQLGLMHLVLLVNSAIKVYPLNLLVAATIIQILLLFQLTTMINAPIAGTVLLEMEFVKPGIVALSMDGAE